MNSDMPNSVENCVGIIVIAARELKNMYPDIEELRIEEITSLAERVEEIHEEEIGSLREEIDSVETDTWSNAQEVIVSDLMDKGLMEFPEKLCGDNPDNCNNCGINEVYPLSQFTMP